MKTKNENLSVERKLSRARRREIEKKKNFEEEEEAYHD
jgi:hypothetical protein